MSGATVVITDVVWPDVEIETRLCAAAGLRARLVGSHDEDVLRASVADAEGILTCFAPVTRAVIEAAPRLRVVARMGVGLDNIDVRTAQQRGIRLTRVPDYCVDEVATHALAIGLALWRRLPAYDRVTRAGGWGIQPDLPVPRLAGAMVAVLGRGPIGREVRRRWAALGTQVTGDPAGADLVSVHLPLTERTRGTVDERVFDRVRPGAVVVNCGRGGLLDLDAALRALDDGRLRGLGLDVYPVEPPPPEHPLLARDDVLLSPHVAFYSTGSLRELRERATASVVRELTR